MSVSSIARKAERHGAELQAVSLDALWRRTAGLIAALAVAAPLALSPGAGAAQPSGVEHDPSILGEMGVEEPAEAPIDAQDAAREQELIGQEFPGQAPPAEEKPVEADLGEASPRDDGAPPTRRQPPAFETAAIPPRCGPVVVAEFSWPAAELAAALLMRLIRDGYGCDAARLPASPAPALAAAASGAAIPVLDAVDQDGAATSAADSTLHPLIAPGVLVSAAEAADGAAAGAVLYAGAPRDGWYAPDWLLKDHPRIRSLADAASAPELFAPASGGRPRVYLCPEHWPCHADSAALVERLDMAGRFEVVTPISGDALTAALIDAFIHGDPWLGFYWAPSTTLAEYPMGRLKTDGLTLCEGEGQVAGAQNCREPFSRPDVVTAYSASLAEQEPRLAELLERFSIPLDMAQEALAWKLANSATYDETATNLLQTQPRLWRGWLDDKARAELTSALVAEVRRGGD